MKNFKALALATALAAGSSFVSLNPTYAATCWFEVGNSGRMASSYCSTHSRINANGHTVYDVVDHLGTKMTLVFWVNRRGDRQGEVELISSAGVTRGIWYYDSDGDRRIETHSGEMAIRL